MAEILSFRSGHNIVLYNRARGWKLNNKGKEALIVYRFWILMLGGFFGLAIWIPGLPLAQQSHCVSLHPVLNLPIGATAKLGGTVVLDKLVMMSAQVAGRIKQIAGEEGSHFKKNAVLAQINTDQLEAQWQAALANIAKAEVTLREARVQYHRELNAPRSRALQGGGMGIPSLFDQMFTKPVSETMGHQPNNAWIERSSDLHTALVRIEQANTGLMQAQSNLHSLKTKFRDSRSIAPFDGAIIKKFIEVGDTVQPGMPLLQFANVDTLQIKVDVPIRLRPQLRLDMVVDAKLDTFADDFPVRVAQIAPIANSAKHTVEVKFDFKPGFRGAVAGMYAEVQIKDKARTSKLLPVIPYRAITQRGSLPSVYVLNRKGKVEMRLVRLGDEIKNHHQMSHGVVVMSGLEPDDRQICLPSRTTDVTPATSRFW